MRTCLLNIHFWGLFFLSARRDTFGHIEAAIFKLLVLLAQRASLTAEVNAAVHEAWFLKVILCLHWGAFGTRIQPVAAYGPQQHIHGPVHAACCKQGESTYKMGDFYAWTKAQISEAHTCWASVHNLSNATKCNAGAPASQTTCKVGNVMKHYAIM